MERDSANVREFYDKVHGKEIPNDIPYKLWKSIAYGQLDSLMKYLARSETVLEIGAGVCLLSHLHPNYIGVDLSMTALKGAKTRRIIQCSAQTLAFKEYSFDMIFTNAALEHMPEPGEVFKELDRVLKPGGILWFFDAWFCRSWKASGIELKSYAECTPSEKAVKFSIPIRDNRIFRGLYVAPRRFYREMIYLITRKPTAFLYKKLIPNLDRYDIADADAVSSIDPHEVQLWFRSRGYAAEEKSTFLQRLLLRGVVVLRKPNRGRPYS